MLTFRQSLSVTYEGYWYWIRELHDCNANWNLANTTTVGHENDDELNSMDLALGSSILPAANYGTNMQFAHDAEFAALFGMNQDFDLWTPSMGLDNT